ncbi:MAG: efflux RND transporter periplasmic adaptor subunit [Sedimentisphaerales bacterium]|nr:efflux RND transporter periplasmic adaptor subunit [Sedimentisphaerales bacterium]MBN2841953.1 efflux RND transporter periplasmic adaptor subunit [Sedimentisphaerales bacterium]
MSKAKLFIKVIIAVSLILGTVITIKYMAKNKPEIGKTPMPKTSYLAEVMTAAKVSKPVTIKAMGSVVPVRKIVLKSRVAGQILAVNDQFRPGGHLSADQTVVTIEPDDYELAVLQSKGQLTNAQAALALEQGKQQIASREWELVNAGREITEQDKSLALRQPQLMQAQANVEISRSALKKSELDLSRTQIKAPFNSMVLSKSVDKGTNVNIQETLAELVDIDKFWIEVSIPLDELKWLEIPDLTNNKGSQANIFYNDNIVSGKVIGILTNLENKGKMARALIEVEDPLDLKTNSRQPLLLGDYVKVEIEGKIMENIVTIPRTAWRDDNNVWLAVSRNGSYELEIRPAETIWRDEKTVAISEGLNNDELLVISAIASPVQGMSLRLAEVKPVQ